MINFLKILRLDRQGLAVFERHAFRVVGIHVLQIDKIRAVDTEKQLIGQHGFDLTQKIIIGLRTVDGMQQHLLVVRLYIQDVLSVDRPEAFALLQLEPVEKRHAAEFIQRRCQFVRIRGLFQ